MKKIYWAVLALTALMGNVRADGSTPIVDPASVFTNIHSDPLYDQQTYQALHDVIIDVSWNQTELSRVLRDLTLAVRSAQPVNTDVNFFMSSSAPADFRHRPVSLTMKRATVFEILEAMAGQARFTVKIHPGIVLVMPR
jgi:hypothetical protein